ncbi:LuxR C-terminal-related transcriptional regulator [Hyphomicrobium sulfonivorans]|uniref:LuxR C-terminal-related transcriptional regulator n=1 Tax=Hyphomicrobium sulfonivorans TaxID=121290 RepID=UPI00156DDC1A|nr:response regulator transcription factor [Hyphomicrobium sulfonivorans]MBI1649632.1 response regulator transcription factor [Hyphomicrobium sulfonivorans]NSL71548.1 DNA-binding response regulator [Hyphomicrobium sulfonivorans]
MKVIIADDHWVVRQSLKQVMRRLNQTLETYEAETFGELTALLGKHPDTSLVLLDLVMPGFEELGGLRALRTKFRDVPVVIVSVHEDVEYVIRSVEQGAIGYIPKSSDGPEIERALERVLAGEVSFPRRILERSRSSSPPPPKTQASSARDVDTLTERERDVLSLLGSGSSVKNIAEKLGLSSQTVRIHIGNAMKKLNLPDRTSAVHYAVTHFGRASV